jgi:hypothetical protein
MRSLAVVTACLLGLGALTFVPGAAAYPPVCIEKTVTRGALEVHFDQCGDESVSVVDCSSGGAQRIYYSNDDGPVDVLVDYCLPHGPPP